MNKIKVLHICKYYPPYVGGMESFCHDLVSALNVTGKYDQMVFCFNDTKETIEETYEGVNVIRLGVQTIIASQPLAKKYKKELKRVIDIFKPDIIHFMYPNPFAAFCLLKCKYEGLLHLDWICDIVKQKNIKKLFKNQAMMLLKRADYVTSITPSYYENTDYLPYYKGKKDFIACRVGDYRLNITEKQKEKANNIKNSYSGKKIIFFFGRHTEYKGLTYLIKSNEYLDQDKIHIIIAGSGELTRKLKHQAKKYKNISFVGRLSNDDINSYLFACDIFAFPSITRNEAFGISLAEAMCFGKPSCTFTIPGSGVNWVSPNRISGLEAKNKDYIEFAQNIMLLSEDELLYDSLSKGALNRYQTLFTKEVFEKKVTDVYETLSRMSKVKR